MIERGLECFVVGILVSSAVGLLAALSGHFLAPQVLLAGVAGAIAYARFAPATPSSATGLTGWPILILFLLTMFFRIPAYDYVLGGQDEGVYVNMAAQIERTGGISVSDNPLLALRSSDAEKPYLDENRVVAKSIHAAKGSYLPGVYTLGSNSARLEFQFYHLLPVWMAIVGGLTAPSMGVYALSLFALLSVVFAYRLVLLLTDSGRAALIVGALFAINPLHAFFSKFPVTEIQALAFSLIGFTFLARYWITGTHIRRSHWLVISCVSFAALFFTRISGFMYIPFFLGIGMVTAIHDEDHERAKAIQWWVLGTLIAYAISVIYGLKWSGSYARDIYTAVAQQAFGGHLTAGLSVVMVVPVAAWLICWCTSWIHGVRVVGRNAVAFARSALGPVLFLGVLIATYRLYLLGWTDYYLHKWAPSGHGWDSAAAASAFTLLVFMGPVLPFVYLGSALGRSGKPPLEFLRFFSVGFVLYALLLVQIIPYGPYYARYLLSEVVPYTILFIVLSWHFLDRGWIRKAIGVALAASGLYMGGASICQLGKQEAGGLRDSLAQLVLGIDSSDLILLGPLKGSGLSEGEVKTPLVFIFGKPVVTVRRRDIEDAKYLVTLASRYDDLYLISTTGRPPEGFVAEGSTRVRVQAFAWGHYLPTHVIDRANTRLFRFRLVALRLPLGVPQPFGTTGVWSSWLGRGWSVPEAWGVWAVGNRSVLELDPKELPHTSGGLRLSMKVRGLVTASHPHQKVILSVNGKWVSEQALNYPANHMDLMLKLPASTLRNNGPIEIEFRLPDAASPRSLGINGDGRVLSIGLETLTVTKLEEQPSTNEQTLEPRAQH